MSTITVVDVPVHTRNLADARFQPDSKNPPLNDVEHVDLTLNGNIIGYVIQQDVRLAIRCIMTDTMPRNYYQNGNMVVFDY